MNDVSGPVADSLSEVNVIAKHDLVVEDDFNSHLQLSSVHLGLEKKIVVKQVVFLGT